MRGYTFVVIVIILLTVMLDGGAIAEKFCGWKLNHLLTRFCKTHNAPDQRTRRQVVTECCHNKCSVQYLAMNYCRTYDSAALEDYLKERKKESAGVNLRKHRESRRRRKARRCTCKNEYQPLRSQVPASKVGEITDDQRPFYVLTRV